MRTLQNTAGCHNVTEHKHILRKYKGSKEFKQNVHITVTSVNIMTIFYSYVD